MTNLKVPKEKAIQLLTDRINSIPEMFGKEICPGYYDIVRWCSKTWAAVDEIYGSGDPHAEEIRLIALPACSCNVPGATPMQFEIYQEKLQKYIDEIEAGMQTTG
jgi:hypothetical protein